MFLTFPISFENNTYTCNSVQVYLEVMMTGKDIDLRTLMQMQ